MLGLIWHVGCAECRCVPEAEIKDYLLVFGCTWVKSFGPNGDPGTEWSQVPALDDVTSSWVAALTVVAFESGSFGAQFWVLGSEQVGRAESGAAHGNGGID